MGRPAREIKLEAIKSNLAEDDIARRVVRVDRILQLAEQRLLRKDTEQPQTEPPNARETE